MLTEFFRNIVGSKEKEPADEVLETRRGVSETSPSPVPDEETLDLADLSDLHPEIGSIVKQKNKIEAKISGDSSNREAQQELEEVNLHLALVLKDVWYQGRYIESGTGLKKGAANQHELNLMIKNNAVEQALFENPIYTTDVVGSDYFPEKKEAGPDFVEQHDDRQLWEYKDFKKFADFALSKVLESIPKEGEGPAISLRLEKLMNAFLTELEGKKIFTRPGINGLQDLLEEPILTQNVFDQMLSGLPEAEAQKKEAELYKDLIRLFERINTLNENLELQKINLLDDKNVPLEIQLSVAENQAVEDAIRTLQAEGIDLRFQTKVQTDKETLEAISRISLTSQENFILSWLPDLIEKGIRPKTTISKLAAEVKAEKEDTLRKKREKLLLFDEGSEEGTSKKKAELEEEIAEIEESLANVPTREQLEADVDLILASVSGYKEVVALDKDLTVEQQERLSLVNESLVGVNKEYAHRRMVFDNADERTSEAQEVLKKMMFVGPLAHGLELMHLGAVAKLFASSADDLMGEWAEIQALRGSGFSLKSILNRLKIGVPVFAAASYGAFQVEALLESGHDLAAGTVFGLTAVALSATTAIQSMKMYHDCYMELIKEGKIDDKQSVLQAQPQFKELWKKFEADVTQLTPEGLVAMVEKSFAEIPEAILSVEDRQAIIKLLPTDEKGVREYMEKQKESNWYKTWKKALEQDFCNPARLGIAIGITLAPLGGLTAASMGLLSNGFVLAGIGSMESVAGGVTVLLARRLNEYKYKLGLKDRLEKLKGSAAGEKVPGSTVSKKVSPGLSS